MGALQTEIAYQRIGVGVRPRLTAGTRSRDIESPQTSGGDELHRPAHRLLQRNVRSIDDQVWPPALPAALDGAGRSTARTAECNDERRIAILDVPVCALVVSPARELAERVIKRNHAVFGTPPGGAPSATAHTDAERCIESGAIDAGLTAGNYLERPLRCAHAPSG